MGTTYSNCQVKIDSQEAVVEALRGLLKEPAYAAPAVNGWVSVYPEGYSAVADKLAKKLSLKLSCGVLFWSVYDSDIFFYTLYENGQMRDEFDSNPDYFEEVSPAKKTRLRGKPEALLPYCVPGVGYAQVQEVLHPPLLAEGERSLPFEVPMPSEKSIQLFSKLLKTTPDEIKAGFAEKRREKYLFADQQAGDLANLLGIAEDLEQCRYRDIAQVNGDYASWQFRLVGNENLSQSYINGKLWDRECVQKPEKMKEWIGKGADPNARNGSAETVLMNMARYGLLENIKILVEAGADVNAATTVTQDFGLESGVTPLMSAVIDTRLPAEWRIATVRLLLNYGANVHAKSETGRTALRACFGFMNPADQSFYRPLTSQQKEQAEQIAQVLREAGATE